MLDGTNWDVLTENDTDIEHTLVDDTPFFRIYELDKDAYIRWNMAGSGLLVMLLLRSTIRFTLRNNLKQ